MKNLYLPAIALIFVCWAVTANSADRWIKQTKLVETPTETGNCLAASVASIMNIPLKDVPEFEKYAEAGGKWYDMFRQFMYDHGYETVRFDGEVKMAGLYIVDGPSPRVPGAFHVVVMKNGKLFHDPHPSNAGLLSIRYTYAFVPLDPAVKR